MKEKRQLIIEDHCEDDIQEDGEKLELNKDSGDNSNDMVNRI